MSQLFQILQEPLTIERATTRTILSLLREKMDGVDHGRSRRSRTLKERLGWGGMGCCGGSTWSGFRPTTTNQTIINGSSSDSEDDQDQPHHQLQLQLQLQDHHQTNQDEAINVIDPDCSMASPAPVNSTGSSTRSINLAAALAAERHFRAVEEETNSVDAVNNDTSTSSDVGPTDTMAAQGTPLRMSLMRLLAETDGEEERKAVGIGGGEKGGNDTVCCVCMVRKKGAAFIPCGHTFCRVCSREVWLNRGSCPLCNRSILEILDIF